MLRFPKPTPLLTSLLSLSPSLVLFLSSHAECELPASAMPVCLLPASSMIVMDSPSETVDPNKLFFLSVALVTVPLHSNRSVTKRLMLLQSVPRIPGARPVGRARHLLLDLPLSFSINLVLLLLSCSSSPVFPGSIT